MSKRNNSAKRFRPQLYFLLMAALLIILWLSGGASRGDVIGQTIVRATCWLILIAIILFGRLPHLRPIAPVGAAVMAVIGLLIVQLIPLPPSIWTALPGRDLLEQAALINGLEQPWRPLSISPGGTVNALWSLIVPFVALLLAASLGANHQWRVVALLLGLVVASSLVGLLEFSGGEFDHPLINDVPSSVSASFANRNHFALFVAIGCVLAPAWAFHNESRTPWKALVATGVVVFFALIILATGSRTGMLVGGGGIALGLWNVRRQIKSNLSQWPKAVARGAVAVGAAVLVTAITISVMAGRALSFERAFLLEMGDDMRRQALPKILEMIAFYFPFGSGFGAFDPVYRIHEPENLLGLAYFNHAHNDFLEVLLEGGAAGLLVLVAVTGWCLWKSFKVWRSNAASDLLARAGSAILLLTLIASLTDYPARTPMIMALVVIAAVWLNGVSDQRAGQAVRPKTVEREPAAGEPAL